MKHVWLGIVVGQLLGLVIVLGGIHVWFAQPQHPYQYRASDDPAYREMMLSYLHLMFEMCIGPNANCAFGYDALRAMMNAQQSNMGVKEDALREP